MAGNLALFGIYLNFTCLQKCVDCLRAIGVRTTDVAILLAAGPGRTNFALVDEAGLPKIGCATHGSEGALLPSFLGSTTRISVPASGVFTGTLINLGVPVYETERYENRIQNGGVLVSVRCTSSVWLDRVKEILKQTGAEDISLSRDARAQANSVPTQILVAPPYVPQLQLSGNGALLTQQNSGAQASSEG